ncbi:succinylglutamate desuccinylase/aspartoacylase family protein [Chryseobacterium foetidum]|uniref:succinylglutamate desuccinylase/aspartoacylase family protein n=1 Tax=Chryseobacterium foetidum TaxID=2951057 RepID=UPI0021C5F80C|nr:M14 family metallopeptidase [Chryseobacterium foetidum]
MIKSVSKLTAILLIASFSVMKAQSIKEIVNTKGSFRKDMVFPIKNEIKETHIPVSIIKGKNKGPVFTIVAGIHGYEYPPIIAVQEVLNEIKPENINGTLIIIPIASVKSFQKRTPFVNPLDGKNLNNAFPGSKNGTPTDKIADFITKEIIANSDIFLDIHGGDASEDLLPFVCFYERNDTADQTALALNLSKASGMKNIVSYPYTLKPSDPSKYAFKEATQQGITALSIEAGKLGNVHKENVDLIKKSVYRMLSFSGNLTEKSSDKIGSEKQRFFNNQDYIRVPEDGIFYSMLKSGDEVKKNQILGYITDEFGNRKKEIISETDGVILYKVGTPPVNKGETLFCIGYFN